MNCSEAIKSETSTGSWICKARNEECLFFEPDSKRCAEMYQFGPDINNPEIISKKIENEIEDVIFDEEGAFESEEEMEEIINGY